MKTQTCALCDTMAPDAVMASEAGWFPKCVTTSGRSLGPICPECRVTRCRDEGGKWVFHPDRFGTATVDILGGAAGDKLLAKAGAQLVILKDDPMGFYVLASDGQTIVFCEEDEIREEIQKLNRFAVAVVGITDPTLDTGLRVPAGTRVKVIRQREDGYDVQTLDGLDEFFVEREEIRLEP